MKPASRFREDRCYMNVYTNVGQSYIILSVRSISFSLVGWSLYPCITQFTLCFNAFYQPLKSFYFCATASPLKILVIPNPLRTPFPFNCSGLNIRRRACDKIYEENMNTCKSALKCFIFHICLSIKGVTCSNTMMMKFQEIYLKVDISTP